MDWGLGGGGEERRDRRAERERECWVLRRER